MDRKASTTRVERAAQAISKHGFVIMVDDEDRENEGDLVIAADCVTADHINFMVTHARGLVCLTLAPNMVDRLNLPMMADHRRAQPSHSTAFTVSIEARQGVTTGISAADRAHTIRTAIDPNVRPDDIVVPGHIFPLRAKSGGVLERAGHTEGSVDLARLAGMSPSGVICEIMNPDGSMARRDDLEGFSKKFDIPIVSIADLVAYRLRKESLIKKTKEGPVHTSAGRFDGYFFESTIGAEWGLALVNGQVKPDQLVDVRVQAAAGTSDMLRGSGVSYGLQLLQAKDPAILLIVSAGDSDLADHIKQQIFSQELSDQGKAKMDARAIGFGAQILRFLGAQKMRLHSRTNRKIKGLAGYQLEIIDTIIIKESPNGRRHSDPDLTVQ